MRSVRVTWPLVPRLDELREELLGSPLLGASTLGGPFRGSRGFAAIFTAEGLPGLLHRFPALAPFLDRVLAGEWARVQRRARREEAPNAFYLNLLVVEDGHGVRRHLDATLRMPSGDEHALPVAVSVLYLEAPPRGGELRIEARPWARVIRPRPNLLVTFRGDLFHEVAPGPPGRRTSVVLEQYHLRPAALARLPPVRVESRAGFAAFLELHHGKGRGPAAG